MKTRRKLKSVVLLSGGLDSTVNLYEALNQTEILLVLTVDYGQRAAKKEIQTAKKLTKLNGLPHRILDLKWIRDLGKSSLTNYSQSVPTGASVQINNLKRSESTAKSVWVPNRNGIFLNAAAAFAESLGADLVIPGFNLEEATTFPDNSEGFLRALSRSFKFSTASGVCAVCFTTKLNKSQIVKRGIELQVPFEKIWPCYFAGSIWCGKCESCLRSLRAFETNGLDFKAISKG